MLSVDGLGHPGIPFDVLDADCDERSISFNVQ